ncbi:MAG: hypothetical protein GXP14_11320 [Gammaproteobacteria bacterium]|nr:hypothetical protein [Gammaproteobacteria bacterium]
MKNTLNLKQLGITIIVIFGMMFAGAAQAVKVGKYQVGMILDPISAAATWKSATGYECRVVDQSELLSLLSVVENKTEKQAIKIIEGIKQTRTLTTSEIAFCKKLIVLDKKAKIWKVAVSLRCGSTRKEPCPTRPTKNIVTVGAIKMLGITTKIKAAIGLICGEKIKGINKRYEYREVKISDDNYAAVCE